MAQPTSFTVQEQDTLLNFLYQKLSDKSKTTVKSYLAHRQVSVNGCMSTQFDQCLQVGDRVDLNFGKVANTLRHPMLRIVFEDDYLIVIEKKNGLLSIATDKQDIRTAFNILSDYVKGQDPANRIFVVHRLDRETSGLMLFSKDQELKHKMQIAWEDTVLERKYYAVAEGVIEKDQGTISTYLTESKALKVYATNKEEGKIANTGYRVLRRSKIHTLLELELETGRKNQIRCHLEYVGHPIIGDKKYGARTNPIGRVALHAGKLCFIHPATGERLNFETPIPRKFSDLF